MALIIFLPARLRISPTAPLIGARAPAAQLTPMGDNIESPLIWK